MTEIKVGDIVIRLNYNGFRSPDTQYEVLEVNGDILKIKAKDSDDSGLLGWDNVQLVGIEKVKLVI